MVSTPPWCYPVSDPADQSLLQALAAVQTALDQVGAPAMIIGGMALIARGIPRLTHDIDATVWGAGLGACRPYARSTTGKRISARIVFRSSLHRPTMRLERATILARVRFPS